MRHSKYFGPWSAAKVSLPKWEHLHGPMAWKWEAGAHQMIRTLSEIIFQSAIPLNHVGLNLRQQKSELFNSQNLTFHYISLRHVALNWQHHSRRHGLGVQRWFDGAAWEPSGCWWYPWGLLQWNGVAEYRYEKIKKMSIDRDYRSSS